MATDPENGSTEPKPVIQLHINVDTELTDVTVRDAKRGTSSVLKTTAHQPIWDATTNEWTGAGNLVAGHQLLVAHDDQRLEGDNSGAGSGGGGPPATAAPTTGDEAVVVGVINHAGAQIMRDLTVADTHTYHVIAGNKPVLVHNTDDGCGRYLYRADTRGKDEIHEIGFEPRGEDTDIGHHVAFAGVFAMTSKGRSAYVATTTSKRHAFQRTGSVYVIDRTLVDSNNQVDVNRVLPKNIFSDEMEIAIRGAVDPSVIVGAWVPGTQGRVWVENTNYEYYGR